MPSRMLRLPVIPEAGFVVRCHCRFLMLMRPIARIADQRCDVKVPTTMPPVVSMTVKKILDGAA